MTGVAPSAVAVPVMLLAIGLTAPALELGSLGRVQKVGDKPLSLAAFARPAASAWFIAVAVIYARSLAGAVHVISHGSLALTDWSSVVSLGCSLTFFITLGWLMLARPPAIARRTGALPTAIAFVGSYAAWLLPLLPAARLSPMLTAVSAALTLCGSLLIVLALIHLGRSFSIAPQARKLVTRGPYRLVRHPLYAAEEIAIIGVLLQYAWYAALPFLVVHMALQIRRMAYEETLLRATFPDYEAYARRTARLIPGVW